MFEYDNIGGKIKGWAKWIFAIEAIATIIMGLIFMGVSVLAGFLLMLFGPIAAWVSSWILYGYGQLIENSDIIAEEYKRVNEKHDKVVAKRNAEKQAKRLERAKVVIGNPNVADDEFVDITCPNCKTELSYTKEQLLNDDLNCPMCDAHISL